MALTNYDLVVTKTFKKYFNSLDSDIKDRIKSHIIHIEEDPYTGKHLHGNLKGLYSFRVGKYRVIYSIEERPKRIVLYFVGHRKGIYDKL
ncbi:MAG: type II toxin-antitoxin system RelE/ParE family toxin [Candidatus Aenigmarchaeota archaeon]|nr:type II toxin-antitoxin system RelE/ParE family toxin [Candidatus Aenigmarchaeota archaeon]